MFIHCLSLDIREPMTQAYINVKKGDTARKLIFTFSNYGSAYHISDGCTAVFRAKKPDGTILFNSCTINGNAVEYIFTSQTVAAVGIVECEVTLADADGKQITSPRFALIVENVLYSDDEVESTNEFTKLQEALAKVSGLGSASISMRVDGGYIQYSTDNGKTWVNLIAESDLKGGPGTPGTPGKDGHSPVVTATKSGKTTTISVDGTAIATVEDGTDGAPGVAGTPGKDGTSITISGINESTADGGTNTVTFSDGSALKVKNGSKGSTGADGTDGITPHIGDNGNWYLGATDTGKPSRGAAGSAGQAGKDGKSAYQYAHEGGYTGTEAEFTAKLAAEKFANPNALTFTGAVTGSYDGSAPLSVEIPSGGGSGSDISLGLTGAAVGQIAKITAVDDTGKPTVWEAVDMPSGGGTSEASWHAWDNIIVPEGGLNAFDFTTLASGEKLSDHQIKGMFIYSPYAVSANDADQTAILTVNGDYMFTLATFARNTSGYLRILLTVENSQLILRYFKRDTYDRISFPATVVKINRDDLHDTTAITNGSATIIGYTKTLKLFNRIESVRIESSGQVLKDVEFDVQVMY